MFLLTLISWMLFLQLRIMCESYLPLKIFQIFQLSNGRKDFNTLSSVENRFFESYLSSTVENFPILSTVKRQERVQYSFFSRETCASLISYLPLKFSPFFQLSNGRKDVKNVSLTPISWILTSLVYRWKIIQFF